MITCQELLDRLTYVVDWLTTGGAEALATCQGRDITSLFESYHAFNMSKPRQVLAKMKEVGMRSLAMSGALQCIS
jgi:hypothetical protein